MKTEDYFSHARREILPLLPHHAPRALEVGCGAGHTLSLLKQQGLCDWVCGIEISQTAATQASERLDQVVQGNIEAMELPLEPGSIDLLLCLDVLEHLVDPWETLRRLATLLRPNGVLVASIPNVRYYRVLLPLMLGGRWDYQDSGILDRTHLRFFTRATAIELVESAGFSIERVSATNAHTRNWKYRLLDALTLSRVQPYFEFQYLIRADRH
ncbi:class I SAM-dependent methyltransferase [Thiobacillus sp.]|uniref:class I SAM-dependent methyltransferase n=1 Tax=Thiobacillus sp. TaxID=924 RepID=UPI0025F93CD2|nr:class I SAM-dependent methyltransferase [Thiobacillus sp.]